MLDVEAKVGTAFVESEWPVTSEPGLPVDELRYGTCGLRCA